jgi:Tim17/Tim22/Tim23/Pmp24 family
VDKAEAILDSEDYSSSSASSQSMSFSPSDASTRTHSSGSGGSDLGAAIYASNLGRFSFGENFGSDQSQEKSKIALHDEKKYLHLERRSLWGQMSYNIGYSYFTGLVVGGFYGFVYGVRNSPNNTPRVLLNGALNGSGKFGAKVGNTAGVLALVYTFTERQFEDAEIDRLPSWVIRNVPFVSSILSSANISSDWIIPATTAFATGILFTLPRAMTMKGIEKRYVSLSKRVGVVLTGGIATLGLVGLVANVGPAIYGQRSPFRFA